MAKTRNSILARHRAGALCAVFVLGLLPSLPVAGAASSIDDLSVVTENYPPYNFKQDGKLQGIAVDLVIAMFERLGSGRGRDSIKLWPWARGYQQVLRKRGTVLFSMTRTAEREDLFKWVGPISPTTISLIARRDRGVKIDSVDDIRRYRVGVVIDDVGEQLLFKMGFRAAQLDRVSGSNVTRLSINKLNRGRIDVWSYEQNVAMWEIRKMGFDPNDYEVVYVLDEGQIFYAFHKDTPGALIARIQKALDALKREGRYREILDRYLK